MRTFISYLVIISLSLLITNCESNVTDVKLPEFRQKLVIAAFLNPTDTVSLIQVGTSTRIYGNQFDLEPLGVISGSISDGTTEISLDTAKFGLKLDSRKMKIEYGKTYYLKISTDRGYSAEATCTVPPKRSFTIQADTITIIDPQYSGNGRLEVKTSFNDIQGEEDYYRLQVLLRTYSKISYYNNNWSIRELPVKDHLFSDQNQDGSTIAKTTQSGFNYAMNSDSVRIIIKLYHTEKSYYLYHKSIDNYKGGDNPFAEPTPVYSNITGGLGIFTSFTVDSVVLRLK